MPQAEKKQWEGNLWKYLLVSIVFVFMAFLNMSFPAERIESAKCSNGNCDYSLNDPEDSGFSEPLQKQEIGKFEFHQLAKPNLFLGQIFRSEDSHISAVELDFDVVKQHNNGGKEYSVEIKEVEKDGDELEIQSGALDEIHFQVDELAKFRQKNGKYRFELNAGLQKGKYYFVGIDNSRMLVDKFNKLVLKGNKKDAFKEGTTAIRKDRKTEIMEGDLYFRIFGRK